MAHQFSGRRLREARLAANLKPERLAMLIDRSVYSVHQYERDVQVPSSTALIAIADALGTTVDSFLIEREVSDVVAA